MATTKHQLSIFWPTVSKSNVKKSGGLRERQLLDLKNVKLPSKKSSYVDKDNSIDFNCLMTQPAYVKSEIGKAVYLSLTMLLP